MNPFKELFSVCGFRTTNSYRNGIGSAETRENCVANLEERLHLTNNPNFLDGFYLLDWSKVPDEAIIEASAIPELAGSQQQPRSDEQ